MPEIPETIGPRMGPSPVSVTLSELGTVDLEGSFAHFDGTAASGSFLAALTIRSQNGAILSRVWPSATLAAGDTGDVTYVPLGLSAASSSTLTFAQQMVLIGGPSRLLGWWRLGDAASPFADSNPYLAALPASNVGTGVAYTPQVPGALAGSQDDGAVLFNGLGSPPNANYVNGQFLTTTATNSRWNLGVVDMSVSLWIKPTVVVPVTEGGICGNLTAGAVSFVGWGLVYRWSPGTVRFERWNDGGPFQSLTTAVAAGSWSFVVATYSTTLGAKIYVNGALAASDASTLNIANPSAPMQLGSTTWAPAPDRTFFQGVLDEVAVWGAALSATDVATLYTAGVTA